jgi:hypothetical protein
LYCNAIFSFPFDTGLEIFNVGKNKFSRKKIFFFCEMKMLNGKKLIFALRDFTVYILGPSRQNLWENGVREEQ